MQSTEKVFYACATIELVEQALSFQGSKAPTRRYGMAHFYIRTSDEIVAGSHIAAMCQHTGLIFRNYVYLPSEERKETVHPIDEHAAAYALAERDGEALVLSFVIDANGDFASLENGATP